MIHTKGSLQVLKKPYVNFLGIPIEALTYEDMAHRIDHWISKNGARSHHIACVNAFCVALSTQNKELFRIYNGADIIGPDGMPFVKWIRRFLKVPCDRFDAPDIILYLADISKDKKYSFYFYGGSPEVLEGMCSFLTKRFPHINIVGKMSPPFRPMTPEEDKQLCDEINSLRPDIVCVGLGTPKQDYWIDEHLNKIRGSVFVASGATFDFFGGRIQMAPERIRQAGFEWLYRLFSKDFTRLWRRYTIYNFVFMWKFLLQQLGVKVTAPQPWTRPE